MTKKSLLLISSIIVVLLIFVNYQGTYDICNSNRECAQYLADILRIFLIFIPLFIFSVVLYKIRDEIFQSWLKFSYVWVPLTIILTLLAPEYSSSFLLPVEKSSVSFFMSVLFFGISFVIIVIKYLSLKNKEKKTI